MANRFRELNARFPRRRAFITGASSGLGLALAEVLAQDGWTLGLFDRNVERLANVEGTLSASRIPVIAYPGVLINVASAAAFVSAPGMSAYNASKAGVLSLSETLAAEVQASGIQVSVVMPTYFNTNLLESYRGPERGRAEHEQLMRTSGYTAEQVADELLTAAAAGKMYIVLPRIAVRLWQFKRWLPNTFLRRAGTLREKLKRRG